VDISRKRTRSGAGRPVSGARHHSYDSVDAGVGVNNLSSPSPSSLSSLLSVDESEGGSALAVENAIPENAYRSQMTVVPDSSSLIMASLRNYEISEEHVQRIHHPSVYEELIVSGPKVKERDARSFPAVRREQEVNSAVIEFGLRAQVRVDHLSRGRRSVYNFIMIL
jgi:hypothetical protein